MNKIYNNKISSLEHTTNTGTLFTNIYYPYKKTPKLIAETNEEKHLLKIQQYEIALMDLNLYLDIYPNDSSLVSLYKQYTKELEQLKREFENKYYDLSKSNINKNTWDWLNGKWPWECNQNV